MFRLSINILCFAFFVAGSAQGQTYAIGSSPAGSSTHSTALAFSKVATQVGGINIRVVPQKSVSLVMPLVNSGEMAFGLVGAPEFFLASNGVGYYDGNAMENIVAVGNLFPFRVAMVAREDHPARDIGDLEGARVPSGIRLASTGQITFSAIFAASGLDENTLEPVTAKSFPEAREAFMERRVDVALVAVGTGRWSRMEKSVGAIKILSIPVSDRSLSAVTEVNPAFSVGTFPVEAPVKSEHDAYTALVYDYLIYTHKDTPDEVISEVARLLVEAREELADTLPAFATQDLSQMGLTPGIKFHPAAMKVYESSGLVEN